MADLQLNQNGTYSLGADPRLIALASGRYVVTWTAHDVDGDGTAVMGRIVGADGVPIGDQFVLNTTFTGDQTDPSLAPLPNGGFAAAWFSSETGAVVTRIFGADGLAVGTEHQLSLTSAADPEGPFLARSSASGAAYSIGFVSNVEHEDGTVSHAAYFQLADAQGASTSMPVLVDGSAQGELEIADLGEGRAILVWNDAMGHMRGQIFSGAAPEGDSFLIDPTLTFRVPHVAATLDGGFVVTYSNAGFTWAKPYDSQGHATQAAFTTPTTIAGVYSSAHAIDLMDGRHIVSWLAGDAGGQGDLDIYARVYSADWTAQGRDFRVNVDDSDQNQAPSLAELPDGRVAESWTHYVAGTGDAGASVRTVIFDPRIAAITYTGTAIGDIAVGTRWDDRMSGGGGNDTLTGGAGADTIDGGAGTNTLDFSASDAAVTIDLSTGLGHGGDAEGDVFSSFQTVLGSARSDRVTGDGNVNTLTGGSGNDILNGAGGNDILIGGDGKDMLTGGAGRDLMTGGLLADRFIYLGRKDSSPGADRDIITDFSHAQGDRIDLSAIDANNTTSANDAFKFIGTAAFTHHAGELHFAYSGSSTTIVEADIDGNGTADLQIQLTGHITLAAGDFGL